jgi:hypothetical protein
MLDENKFNNYKNQKNEQQTKTSGFDDPRFVQFQAGNAYRFRLLYWENPEPVHRNGPFLEYYNHSTKDRRGNRQTIICPTTFEPKAGFKKCPTCENNSRLWKSYEGGNQVDGDLYKQFKRKFHGYAMVYVVSDPVTPENNGSVKMMHYTIRTKKWFDREIFGIKSTWKSDGESTTDDVSDPVGIDAFKLDNGYDLIMTVTKQGEWNNYEPKFARKPTSVEVDSVKLEADIKELDFDGTLRRSTEPEIENFFRNVVLDADSGLDIPPAASQSKPAPAKLEPSIPTSTETTKTIEEVDVNDLPELGDDEKLIDDLLADIENDL